MEAHPNTPHPHPKQGLSTGAKVGIGCGIAALVGLIAISIAAYFLYQKGMEVLDDQTTAPQTRIAEQVINSHSDLEFLGYDEEHRLVRARHLTQGTTLTISPEKLFSLSPPEPLAFQVDGAEGVTLFDTHLADKVPSWVPQPSGLKSIGVFHLTPGSGSYTATLKGDGQTVFNHFQSALSSKFGSTSHTSLNFPNQGLWSFSANTSGRSITIEMGRHENESAVFVEWTQSP